MRKAVSGFTLIEVLSAVAIIGILAAIAIPNYTKYVQRGALVEGTNALAQYRVQMEQYYQDNHSYLLGGACGITPPANLTNFTVTCVAANANAYTATATAKATSPVNGATYTIDQSNNQVTVAMPAGFSTSATSWVTR